MAALSILLLGGTGTIGRATAQALRAEEHRVTALIRPGADAGLLPGCTVIRGSIPESLPAGQDSIQNNLNDCTSEGLMYPKLAAFSVQHHPEAAPGPHEAAHLFDEFVALMDKGENSTILLEKEDRT